MKNLALKTMALLCVAALAACNHAPKQKTIECNVSPVEVFGCDYGPQDMTFHLVQQMNPGAWGAMAQTTGNEVYPDIYVHSSDTAAIAAMAQEYCQSMDKVVKYCWHQCNDNDVFELLIIDANPLLDGTSVEEASASMTYYDQPQVDITLNAEAATKWKTITSDNIGKRIAIMLKDRVLSAPMIMDEISGGKASVVGPTQDEICALCQILNDKNNPRGKS